MKKEPISANLMSRLLSLLQYLAFMSTSMSVSALGTSFRCHGREKHSSWCSLRMAKYTCSHYFFFFFALFTSLNNDFSVRSLLICFLLECLRWNLLTFLELSFSILCVRTFSRVKDIFSVCNRLAVDWLIQHLQPTGRIWISCFLNQKKYWLKMCECRYWP